MRNARLVAAVAAVAFGLGWLAARGTKEGAQEIQTGGAFYIVSPHTDPSRPVQVRTYRVITPGGAYHEFGEAPDLRRSNSWTIRHGEIVYNAYQVE